MPEPHLDRPAPLTEEPPAGEPPSRRWIAIGLMVAVLGFGVGASFALAARSADDDHVETASDSSEIAAEPATSTAVTSTSTSTSTSSTTTSFPGGKFTLVNQMSPAMCQVQVSASDDEDWGRDLLGDEPLETADTASFELPDDMINIRATTCDGDTAWSKTDAEIDAGDRIALDGSWHREAIDGKSSETSLDPDSSDIAAAAPASTSPPATTSPPRTTASTRAPATTSPPTTAPSCPYAAEPQNVQYYPTSDTDAGVEFIKFRVEFTSCSPATDYYLSLEDASSELLGGYPYDPRDNRDDYVEFFGRAGSATGKINSYIYRANFMREEVRKMTLCYNIVSTDWSKTWGPYCSTWDNPNRPSWDGQFFNLTVLNDLGAPACELYVHGAYSVGVGAELLQGQVLQPGATLTTRLAGGHIRMFLRGCDPNYQWVRGDDWLTADRTFSRP